MRVSMRVGMRYSAQPFSQKNVGRMEPQLRMLPINSMARRVHVRVSGLLTLVADGPTVDFTLPGLNQPPTANSLPVRHVPRIALKLNFFLDSSPPCRYAGVLSGSGGSRAEGLATAIAVPHAHDFPPL